MVEEAVLAGSQREVDRNYDAFVAELPNLIAIYANKYALMSDAKVVGTYTTLEDAYTAAQSFLVGKTYTVQKITDAPVDLGFFSHAVFIR